MHSNQSWPPVISPLGIHPCFRNATRAKQGCCRDWQGYTVFVSIHLRQAFLYENPHEHHATRSPKTMPPVFGRVAGRSKRRYDKMVGEGDQLLNCESNSQRFLQKQFRLCNRFAEETWKNVT